MGTIVVKDKIGVISAQLYVTFRWTLLWTPIYVDGFGEGLHYKGYIQIYRGCDTFLKFSIERGIIVVKDQIGVTSAQLYVTFWWIL